MREICPGRGRKCRLECGSGFGGISLTDQAGDAAWPIAAPTFILIYRNPEKPEQAAEVLKFFDWAYKTGDKLATDLDYVPLPDNVVGLVQAAWARADQGQVGSTAL